VLTESSGCATARRKASSSRTSAGRTDRVARKRPRNPAQVERAQELVASPLERTSTATSVNFQHLARRARESSGRSRQTPAYRLVVQMVRLRARRLAHGHQVLVDAAADLQTIGLLFTIIGRPRRARPGAIGSVGEDDLLGAFVMIEKADDVGDGGSAPFVDALVIVRDHATLRWRAASVHQLELRIVGVLNSSTRMYLNRRW